MKFYFTLIFGMFDSDFTKDIHRLENSKKSVATEKTSKNRKNN